MFQIRIEFREILSVGDHLIFADKQTNKQTNRLERTNSQSDTDRRAEGQSDISNLKDASC